MRREAWESETRLLCARRVGLGWLVVGLARMLSRRKGPGGHLLTSVSHCVCDVCAWRLRLFERVSTRYSKLVPEPRVIETKMRRDGSQEVPRKLDDELQKGSFIRVEVSGAMKLSWMASSSGGGGRRCCRLGQQACLAGKYRFAIAHQMPQSTSNQSCWNLGPLRCRLWGSATGLGLVKIVGAAGIAGSAGG